MVRRARVLGIFVVIVSTLFGCDYLLNGIFPANVAQETARIDLSSDIPASAGATFNLAVVKSGRYEFVLLFSNSSFDASKNHLYVLTPGLVVQNSFSMTAISDITPPSIPLNGNTAVAHPNDGTIVIGNLQATPGSNGLTLDQKLGPLASPPAVTVDLSNGAIVGPSTASFTWSNFSTDSFNDLVYTQYASDWSTSISQSHPIGRNYNLRGVFTDPEDDQVNTALLVFDENSNNESKQHFITVPKDPDMITAFGGPTAPSLFDNPAYSSFTMTELDAGHIYVVSDGIVSYSYQTQSMVHFTPTTTTSPAALHIGTLADGLVMAFSFSGGFYCTWDPSTRVLTRYEDWW